MANGKVKWFNAQKGFGFIVKDDGTEIFVHFKDVKGGVGALRDGDAVTFDEEQGRKGPQAVNVSKG